MSLALCCVLVVGPQLRALAALLGAGYAIAVGYALVALGWHLPSDVLGGFLVAATFTLLGAAALAALEARRPERVRAARRRAARADLGARCSRPAAAALVAFAGALAIAQRARDGAERPRAPGGDRGRRGHRRARAHADGRPGAALRR